ncbi:hypothetical protein THALO_40107 [Tenacibaculum halocynthiae]
MINIVNIIKQILNSKKNNNYFTVKLIFILPTLKIPFKVMFYIL